MSTNKELAKIFLGISELLALDGESIFKIRAYEHAAQLLDTLTLSVQELAANGRLLELPGIGKSIAEKITEYLSSGKIEFYDELKTRFPDSILEIMALEGVGPKRAILLKDGLGITTLEQLKSAAEQNKISTLDGFGQKSQQNILQSIANHKKYSGRTLLSYALENAENLLSIIKQNPKVLEISVAGSLRRYKETIGDIDILCSVKIGSEEEIINLFINLPEVQSVIVKGTKKTSVKLVSGIQVDLRVVPQTSFATARQYFTGSKEHNVVLRERANKLGLTLNEYGLYKLTDKNTPLPCASEKDIYKALKMHYIPPPLRENRGEIESALENKLPQLLKLTDILGDTHAHTTYSDGESTIEEIAQKAQKLGYQWIVLADHSISLKVANGLDIKKLERKIDEIKEFNRGNSKIKVLCGSEVDILSNGTLDYPNEVLKKLDFVVAAIHTSFKQSSEQITNRIISAIKNPFVHCIAHPTGRLINKREPYAIDIEKVINEASINKKMLEINCYPDRLDLCDTHAKRAKEVGVTLALGSDSHNADELTNMNYGVYTAQRGWISKGNVINSKTYSELLEYLNAC